VEASAFVARKKQMKILLTSALLLFRPRTEDTLIAKLI
jgi:hypothetical protein